MPNVPGIRVLRFLRGKSARFSPRLLSAVPALPRGQDRGFGVGRYALHPRMGDESEDRNPPAGVCGGRPMTRARSGGPAKRGRVPGPRGAFLLAPGLEAKGAIAVGDAMVLVLGEWDLAVARGEMAATTLKTHSRVLATLRTFAVNQKAHQVADLDGELLARWYIAPVTRSGQTPTTNMVALRRSVARSMFRTLSALGITDLDVTSQVPALRRPDRVVAPLTSDQVRRLKDASVRRRGEHSGSAKAPAALALALLGLQSAEIPAVRVRDIDLLGKTVFAHGGGIRYSDRTVTIDDDWAWTALVERVHYLQSVHGSAAADVPVAYEPGKSRGGTSPKNPAAATSNTLDEVFKSAGVKQPGRIRLSSLNEYVALRVYAETGSLMQVAARLGMRSLDRVAAIVDPDWFDTRIQASPHPGDTE